MVIRGIIIFSYNKEWLLGALSSSSIKDKGLLSSVKDKGVSSSIKDIKDQAIIKINQDNKNHYKEEVLHQLLGKNQHQHQEYQ